MCKSGKFSKKGIQRSSEGITCCLDPLNRRRNTVGQCGRVRQRGCSLGAATRRLCSSASSKAANTVAWAAVSWRRCSQNTSTFSAGVSDDDDDSDGSDEDDNDNESGSDDAESVESDNSGEVDGDDDVQ